ncbi:MAG: bifunctional riboflavin kinase/FAD synthetase [Alphaproteobacteria bacterium]|nr:bifunctional riboflavin kinase/FAD synthetase [Alphaproteobacteria bacterium]
MRLFRHPTGLPERARGAVAALGNFDGVHLGHGAVIAATKAIAAELAGRLGQRPPTAVLTFEPHPRMMFQADPPPFRLTPFRIKARQIETLGIDLLFVLRFDRVFSLVGAEDFVTEILVKGLGVAHVVAGYDFVFGNRRRGNAALLHDMSVRHGFGFTEIQPVASPHATIYSSTAIRELLIAGKPADAAALLGRPWEIEGRVQTGDRRGRTIGFPTANLRLGSYLQPALGVYAVRAGVDLGGRTVWHDGVANLGRRPTFAGAEARLEVHLFDFAGDLYGRHLRVQLVEFLRPERKFSGIDELKTQIGQDAARARALLGTPARAS